MVVSRRPDLCSSFYDDLILHSNLCDDLILYIQTRSRQRGGVICRHLTIDHSPGRISLMETVKRGRRGAKLRSEGGGQRRVKWPTFRRLWSKRSVFFFVLFFFFFCVHSHISGVHLFCVIFAYVTGVCFGGGGGGSSFFFFFFFFSLFFCIPSIEIVTFRLRGRCMLGVFLLPAFTRLGHECQDLLSPFDEMHVCTARPRFILSPERVLWNGVRTHVTFKGKIPTTEAQRRVESICVQRDQLWH